MRRPKPALSSVFLVATLVLSSWASAHDDDQGKPLDQTVVLTFTFNNSDAKISTATARFSLYTETSDWETFAGSGTNEESRSEISIELSGTVTKARRGRGWLVTVQGHCMKSGSEGLSETQRNIPKAPGLDASLESVREESNYNSRLEINASAYLRPGEQKLLVADWHQKVLLTLDVYDDE